MYKCSHPHSNNCTILMMYSFHLNVKIFILQPFSTNTTLETDNFLQMLCGHHF